MQNPYGLRNFAICEITFLSVTVFAYAMKVTGV